ncbi:MAG: hypothetical protein GKS00_07510 [Alphaproteobacteria bacterium]|nr:hypothetical protein [Alphaproteobacteria bacterium]
MDDPGNPLSANGDTTQRNLKYLNDALFGLWSYGSNALVGWTPSPRGLEIISVPMVRLYRDGNAHRRVFIGDRIMGKATFHDVARALTVEPMELRLEHPIGDRPNEINAAAVDRLFSQFAVTKTRQRGVFLIDAVGFSLFSPEEQASQLAALEFALNIADETARRCSVIVAMARSTTGDGFYVWNEEKGPEADLRLLCVFVLTMTYLSALRRAMGDVSYVPKIRSCYGVGSHYSYHHSENSRRGGLDYIVGDVTISLARLIDKAKPGQILISEFSRKIDDTGQVLKTPEFLSAAVTMMDGFRELEIMGSRIRQASIYLTGPRQPDSEKRIQRLKVTDKHGLAHYCYNAKVSVVPEDEEPIQSGLEHDELRGGVS